MTDDIEPETTDGDVQDISTNDDGLDMGYWSDS